VVGSPRPGVGAARRRVRVRGVWARAEREETAV